MINRRFILLVFSIPLFFGCSGNRPTDLGVVKGELKPCPSSPNCVSSFAPDEDHQIKPIDYSGSATEAKTKLMEIITQMPRTKVIEENQTYIRVEYTSALMRFVDDVEFLFQSEGVIHVRSASRIGYSDMGANRKRIEAIRTSFQRQNN